jgi:hypothetical protein
MIVQPVQSNLPAYLQFEFNEPYEARSITFLISSILRMQLLEVVAMLAKKHQFSWKRLKFLYSSPEIKSE